MHTTAYNSKNAKLEDYLVCQTRCSFRARLLGQLPQEQSEYAGMVWALEWEPSHLEVFAQALISTREYQPMNSRCKTFISNS